MKYRYSKYRPEDLDGVDLEELLSKLSDMLLSSGFNDPYGLPGEDDGHSMQALHDAILEALLDGAISDELLEKLLGKDWQQAEDAEQRIDELVQRIVQKLQQQGYVSPAPDLSGEQSRRGQVGGRGPDAPARFEITDKSLDFLGYRALRDLLGSIGKSSIGRHDTREMATGIEASGAPKPYTFGDTMNIDAGGTILNAVTRRSAAVSGRSAGLDAGGTVPFSIDIGYEDLMVVQGEYQ